MGPQAKALMPLEMPHEALDKRRLGVDSCILYVGVLWDVFDDFSAGNGDDRNDSILILQCAKAWLREHADHRKKRGRAMNLPRQMIFLGNRVWHCSCPTNPFMMWTSQICQARMGVRHCLTRMGSGWQTHSLLLLALKLGSLFVLLDHLGAAVVLHKRLHMSNHTSLRRGNLTSFWTKTIACDLTLSTMIDLMDAHDSGKQPDKRIIECARLERTDRVKD